MENKKKERRNNFHEKMMSLTPKVRRTNKTSTRKRWHKDWPEDKRSQCASLSDEQNKWSMAKSYSKSVIEESQHEDRMNSIRSPEQDSQNERRHFEYRTIDLHHHQAVNHVNQQEDELCFQDTCSLIREEIQDWEEVEVSCRVNTGSCWTFDLGIFSTSIHENWNLLHVRWPVDFCVYRSHFKLHWD
jgi:hypothetical protein